MSRLPPRQGEWIDRSKRISFRFEGLNYQGFAGDTVSTALYAAGVRLMGRSFKYHRARGVYSLANHDVNVMVEDGRRTNIRADVTPIAPGMDLRAVNTMGGVRNDRLRFNELMAKMMPVGFYYKAFHKPRWLFNIAENAMRKVAGLGRINPDGALTASPKGYDFCDLLVVGSGPAGLSGAVAAAEQGARVIVVDEQPHPGGSMLYAHTRSGSLEKARQLLQKARALPNLELRMRTEAAGYYSDHWVALIDDTRLTKLRAGAVLVATGASDQASVFHCNDLPGVLLGSAVQKLLNLYAIKPFERGVVLTGNSDGYHLALELRGAGVDVAAIADLRQEGEPGEVGRQVLDAGIPVHRGYCVYEAQPDEHKHAITAAVLAQLDGNNQPDPHKRVKVDCGGVAVCVGYVPAGALLYQAGGKMKYDPALEQFVPATLPPGILAAGRVNGVFSLADQIADGARAGLAAARHLGKYKGSVPEAVRHQGPPPTHPYPIYAHPHGKNFVDFDEDVHLADFVNAHQEGFDNIELLKRYSTVGMGASQGKLSNMLAVRILARLNGKSIDETGSTTSRPFYHPVSMGHLAGRRFHPMRMTAMHELHARAGGQFVHVGAWYRPEYYAIHSKSREDCIFDEAANVRKNVGIIDVGTLGKIQVLGPDAVKFIERIYTGKFEKQKVGACRYCLALDESGVIIDDGLVCRLAEDQFYITATTSGADAMYREMQRWLLIWGMQVTLVNSTGRLAAINLVGPKSRDLLKRFTDVDLSPDAFPYIAVREGKVCGVPAKLMRVGFVGELGYEIHFPYSAGPHVWTTLSDAGRDYLVRPFGVEAQRLLRLEKGHIIVSQDTDALTNPYEAGCEFAMGKDKPFYIGQRSLDIVRKQSLTRKLVGITLPKDYHGPWPEECHLIIEGGQITGRVTSFARRSNLGMPIGLAFVKPEHAAPGSRVQIRVEKGQMIDATVVKTPFYDPENLKQKS